MTLHQFMDYLAIATMLLWLAVGVQTFRNGYLIKAEGGTFNVSGSAVTIKYDTVGTVNNFPEKK